MRARHFRLLFPALGLLAGACDDSDSPLEPSRAAEEAPAPEADVAALAGGRWAAGYLLTENATAISYTPSTTASYNAAGGSINVRRPDATTGRYVVTFTGLSAAIGGKNTVQVSAFGSDNTFCKAMTGMLVTDRVEVRCYRTADGAAANATFSLTVLGKDIGRAFAFANQPTATTAYTATNAGTRNPLGSTVVKRFSTGLYTVTFKRLALPSDHGGTIQVHPVSSGKAHCSLS